MEKFREPSRVKFRDSEKNDFIEGMFAAYIIEDGEKQLVHKKNNLIVNGARKVMAHMIGDCETNSDYLCIDQFRLGGNNSLTNEQLLSPPAPERSDTDIVYDENLFIRERGDEDTEGDSLFSIAYPDSPNETSVTFSIRMMRSEGNILHPDATPYNAAGLFSKNQNTDAVLLFASQTMPVMAKTSSREFVFEWTIQY